MFGDSAAGTLKQAVRGRGDRVVSLGDDLSWGPLSSIAERVHWFDANCPIPGGWDWISRAHEEFWKEAEHSGDERLIWLSSNSADEMAGYLAYLGRVDRPAAVLRPDRYLPPHPRFGPLLGTGTANADQLADVLTNAQRGSTFEDRDLSDRWADLAAENALLRIMDGGQLVSAPVDTYDRLLLGAATNDWQKGARIVGNALAASFDERARVNSDFLFFRLDALIGSGALEGDGDVLGWDDGGRRKPATVRKPA